MGVGGEGRAAENLAVRELDGEQRHRVLVRERDRAVIHRHRAGEGPLARLGRVERGAKSGHGARVGSRARGGERATQLLHFGLRLA